MDPLDMDNTEDLAINTSHRHNTYCHKVKKDDPTVRCSLYSPHIGLCKPKHGIEADRFEGVEPSLV